MAARYTVRRPVLPATLGAEAVAKHGELLDDRAVELRQTRGDGRYARWELLDDHLLVALPRGHRLATRRSIDLVELAAEPWIVGGAGGPCHQVGAAACMAAGFAPDVVHEMDDWGAVLRLVAGGCGVGLVPELAVAHGPSADVVLRPPAGAHRPSRHIYAAVRAGAEGSPCIRPVIEALITVARELVASSPRRQGPFAITARGAERRRKSSPRGVREGAR